MNNTSNKPATIYELLQQSAESFGKKAALTYLKEIAPKYVDETIAFSDLLGNVHRMVRLIHDYSDSSGAGSPVVSFLLPNIPQAHYVLWGAETAGIANPLSPLLSEDVLYSLMEKAGTDILIALGPNSNSDIWEKAQSVVERLPKRPKLIPVVFPDKEGGEAFESLLEQYSDSPLPSEWLPKSEDITAYFHTGGTTGSPKLAMHTHRNQMCSAKAYAQSMSPVAGSVIINGLPMFHVAGTTILALGCFMAGSNSVLPTMAGFRNPEVIRHYWKLVEHYRVSLGCGIPTSLVAMADVPIGDADISSLRFMITGGAPAPLSVCQDLKRLTGCETYQIYGMTEAGGAISMPNLACPPPPGSAGYVSGEIEVRIDTESSEANAVGEVCVRSPGVFPGYLGGETSPLDNGWLRSGDLGYLDANKNLFITGRAKDLIIRSGHNIDPLIIENCLESHPAVNMAAAVGKPDGYAGELPVVFVQLHAGCSVTEAELRDYAMANINERPACPKGVFILEALPITAVGKIHKPTLRAFAAELSLKEYLAEFPVDVKAFVRADGGVKALVNADTRDASLDTVCSSLAGRLGIQIDVNKAV